MPDRLQNKVALVTGAGSGIGKAIAVRFAAEGARLGVLDLDSSAAQTTCTDIRSQGGEAIPLIADVRDPIAIGTALTTLQQKFGGLHILVNNAGIARKQMFEQMTGKDWQQVWDTNLTGALSCTRAALPLLRKQPGGKVINLASVEVYSHSRKLSSYAASKGALASVSRALAVELAPDKINVNYLCPGFIKTEMTRRYWTRWFFRKYIERITPAGRMGEPEDVAGAALFLASSDSDFITGQGLVVDGGLTLRSV